MSHTAELHLCSLCGFEFEKADAYCTHGCPFGSACNKVRCPNCGYEFPGKVRLFAFFGRLLGRKGALESSARESTNGAVHLTDVKPGSRAEVVKINSTENSRLNSLAVFGLVPGTEISLNQQRPACVIRVGETDLALEKDIAREIMVRPCGE